jgi:hypothetical protein
VPHAELPVTAPADEDGALLLDGNTLQFADLVEVARHGRVVRLHPEARRRMAASAAWVHAAGAGDQTVYGVTTGFGSLARVNIAAKDRALLSLNLIRSHAAGVGAPLPVPAVRAMMLLRANALSKGASGCRPLLVETLLAMLNAGLTPVVPAQGSCGSSGDLAPLAHLGLVLAEGSGGGRAVLGGEELDAGEAMAHMDPPTPWITWAVALWNARLNQNLLHPATAPFAREAEACVVEWLAPFFGMNGGHMTAGSSLANLRRWRSWRHLVRRFLRCGRSIDHPFSQGSA